MAENIKVYSLTVDTSGTNVEAARKALAALKLSILETEAEAAKLRKELASGLKTRDEVSGPLSQVETRLKALREAYLKTQQSSAGLASFTEKIGSQFAKAVGPIESLLGKLGPMGGAISKLSASLSGIGKNTEDAAGGIGKLNAFTSGIGKAAGGAVLGIGAVIGGIAALGVGIKNSVESYDASIKAQTQLEQALGKTSQALLDQAEALQTTTGFADDAIVKGQAFAASLGLTERQILELTPAVADLAAATGQDIGAAFEQVSTTLAGGRDALKKYGIEIDHTAEKSEQVGQIIAGLGDKFAGQAEAIGNAGAGGIKKFQNNLDDLQESIGEIVVRGIGPFVEGLTEGVGALADWIQPSQELNRELKVQRDSIVGIYSEGEKLVTRYEELAKNTNKTDAEQTEFNATIKRLSELFPSAIKGWNEYGEAVGISSVKVREHLALLNAELKVINAKEIKVLENALTDLSRVGSKVELPELGVVFENSGQSLDKAKQLVSAMDDVRKGQGDLSKEILVTTQTMDGTSQSFVLYQGRVLKLGKGQQDWAKMLKDSNQDFVANEDVVRKFVGRVDGFADRIKERIEELDGSTASKEADKLIASEQAAAAAANAATNAYKDQTATLIQLQEQRKKLAEELAAIPENDATKIAAKTAEIELVDKRIAKYKTETAAAKASNKETALSHEERADQIAASYALEIAKIDEAEENKLLSMTEADKRRNEALSKSLAERIKLEEDAALKASKDGEISFNATITIKGLQAEKDKVDAEVKRFKEQIEQEIKIETQKIKVELEISAASLQNVVADAISMDELESSFDTAFKGVASNFGEDVKAKLLDAAKAGTFDEVAATIDFSGSKEEIEQQKLAISEMRRAYDLFQAETKRNELVFIGRKQQAELTDAKTKLDDLNKELAKLTAERDRKISIGAEVPQEDLDQIDTLQKKRDDLEDKVVTIEVNVNRTTTATNKVEGDIGNLQPGAGGSSGNTGEGEQQENDPVGNFLEKALGVSDEEADVLKDKAKQLVQEINDIFFQGQEDRIQHALQRELDGIEDQYDLVLGSLKAQLENGALSQEEYDARAERAAAETEAKREAARKKAFEDEKKLKRAQIALNLAAELSALAVSAASVGPAAPIFYAVQAGLAGGRAIANLVAVNSARYAEGGVVEMGQGGNTRSAVSSLGRALLVASKGRDGSNDIVGLFNSSARTIDPRTGDPVRTEEEILSSPKQNISGGAILDGPSHDAGGIKTVVGGRGVVELEGGEIVINKRSSSLFAKELSLINSFGGFGKAFAGDSVNNTTYAQGGAVNNTSSTSTQNAEGDDSRQFIHPAFAHGGTVNNTSSSTNNTTTQISPKTLSRFVRSFARGGSIFNTTSSTSRPVFSSYAQGGPVVYRIKSTRGTALVNLREPERDPNDTLVTNNRSYAMGGPISNTSSFLSAPVFRSFSMGGKLPAVFATGGQISLIPSESTIANKEQLERASTPIVIQTPEPKEAPRPTVLYISELDNKKGRMERTQNRVTYGG